METTEVKNCRVCYSEDLTKVLTLGNQAVVDFPTINELKNILYAPLNLLFCHNCHLVQLGTIVNADRLFKKFWYKSSTSEVMRESLRSIVKDSSFYANLKVGDIVCDIGCNDGTMLELFQNQLIKVGFDPSDQINTPEARRRMDYAINDYFNSKNAIEIVRKHGKLFKLVTAIAMFYDLSDPAKFLLEVKDVLAEDGVLVIQMNYLLSMMENNAYDNICHEHITYFSLKTLRYLLNKTGLEIIDASTNSTNGGSIRVYIKRQPIQKSDLSEEALGRIRTLLQQEKDYKLDNIETYHKFGSRINEMMTQLQKYMIEITNKQQTPIYAYGASTRGTVLLQSIDLPLAGVAERDNDKIGRYMVGKFLKIHDEEYVRSRCKYMLVLPWHFKEGIIKRELPWMQDGGRLIFPLPYPHVVEWNPIEGKLEEGKIEDLIKPKENSNADLSATNS